MSIRDYIKKNLSDCSLEDVKATIIESINSNDEVVLPGLGVLFETVWNNSNDDLKNNIANIIHNTIKKA